MLEVVEAPFPHVIADGLWKDELLRGVVSEFPPDDSPAWRSFNNANERKNACEDPSYFGRFTRELLEHLEDERFAAQVGEAFGIFEPQPLLFGGGYHSIPWGGRLEMHVDFNRGPNGLYRRANCLVYLNEDWQPAYGGELMLGGDPTRVIAPRFNRTVLFATSERSFHGHPTRWSGPTPRRSVAVYFFSAEPAEAAPDHSTVFAP